MKKENKVKVRLNLNDLKALGRNGSRYTLHQIFRDLRVGKKGQGSIWGASIGGVFILIGFAIIYIILNQVNTASLRPSAVEHGVYAESLNLLDIAWVAIPIGAVLYFVFSVVSNGLTGGNDETY